MGAKKGDVLAMVVPNIPEFCIAYLGAVGVGVTLTTMNPTYKAGKLEYICIYEMRLRRFHRRGSGPCLVRALPDPGKPP